ncbi:hypothetical protein C8N24_4830 [Solirubrobacter pauli]|uniref:GAF domain-containing protein n=1 Tax=Solirubrobacter pauli TaxID=166793 RepID=A0A660L0F1_9ACTN|nr:helix-turn-helix domain-containing protein [Solirubrobacter pauli]RKQ86815.1 hypothetical protein C8N24_4830 [Solirubrobacter pauli]
MGNRNPWLATDVLTDPRARARELREARARFFGAGTANGVRPLILASWRRSLAAGLRSGDVSPAPAPDDDASARWDAHPLRAGLPFVRDALAAIAEEAQHLTAIADADGRLVWIDGPARLRQAAAELGFVAGAVWSERAAGTNGIGTALAVDHAVQVFAGEHFIDAAQPWTAVAAPVHAPATGAILGAIGLMGRLETVHPHSLALALAAARALEDRLLAAQHERDAGLRERHLDRVVHSAAPRRALVGSDGRVLLAEPRGWLPPAVTVPAGGGDVRLPGDVHAVAESLGPDGAYLLHAGESRPPPTEPVLHLATLGQDQGAARLGREALRLRQRHTELLVLLAHRPDGIGAEELAEAIYGDEGRPSTVRTEMFRLRRLLGRWIINAPYRLTIRVDADFLEVQRRLRAGAVLEAAQAYPAPLLPDSDAPGVAALRDELDDWMRRAVLSDGGVETLWAWLQSASGRADAPAWKRFLATVDFGDPRRSLAACRVAQLRASGL